MDGKFFKFFSNLSFNKKYNAKVMAKKLKLNSSVPSTQ